MKLFFIYNKKDDCLMTNRQGKNIQGKTCSKRTKRAMDYHIKMSQFDCYKIKFKKEDYKIIEVDIK